MAETIYAVFDGKALWPEEALPLPPNTRVRMVLEPIDLSPDKEYAFLDIALSLNLDGPPDWAERLEEYLYGETGEV